MSTHQQSMWMCVYLPGLLKICRLLALQDFLVFLNMHVSKKATTCKVSKILIMIQKKNLQYLGKLVMLFAKLKHYFPQKSQ